MVASIITTSGRNKGSEVQCFLAKISACLLNILAETELVANGFSLKILIK